MFWNWWRTKCDFFPPKTSNPWFYSCLFVLVTQGTYITWYQMGFWMNASCPGSLYSPHCNTSFPHRSVSFLFIPLTQSDFLPLWITLKRWKHPLSICSGMSSARITPEPFHAEFGKWFIRILLLRRERKTKQKRTGFFNPF